MKIEKVNVDTNNLLITMSEDEGRKLKYALSQLIWTENEKIDIPIDGLYDCLESLRE